MTQTSIPWTDFHPVELAMMKIHAKLLYDNGRYQEVVDYIDQCYGLPPSLSPHNPNIPLDDRAKIALKAGLGIEP